MNGRYYCFRAILFITLATLGPPAFSESDVTPVRSLSPQQACEGFEGSPGSPIAPIDEQIQNVITNHPKTIFLMELGFCTDCAAWEFISGILKEMADLVGAKAIDANGIFLKDDGGDTLNVVLSDGFSRNLFDANLASTVYSEELSSATEEQREKFSALKEKLIAQVNARNDLANHLKELQDQGFHVVKLAVDDNPPWETKPNGQLRTRMESVLREEEGVAANYRCLMKKYNASFFKNPHPDIATYEGLEDTKSQQLQDWYRRWGRAMGLQVNASNRQIFRPSGPGLLRFENEGFSFNRSLFAGSEDTQYQRQGVQAWVNKKAKPKANRTH